MNQALLRQRAKRLMRKRFRAARNAVPAVARRQRSKLVCDRVAALEVVANATSVALFYPIVQHGEIDLRELDADLRQAGKQLAYPVLSSDRSSMEFRWVAHLATMAERGNRFQEPDSSAPVAERIDVIVVPGLAFDARGYRLGYGGGYYDRTLPLHAKACHIGVGFDFQLASDLPVEDQDVPVHLVITDKQTLEVT